MIHRREAKTNSLTAQQIATAAEGTVIGNPTTAVRRLAHIQDAGAHDVLVVYSATFLKSALASPSTCIVVDTTIDLPEVLPDSTLVICDSIRAANFIVDNLYPTLYLTNPASLQISESAQVADTATIGHGCIVGDDVVIEEGATIFPNSVIYPGVKIGRDTLIHANVTICENVVIGERCIIHSGAVIGADGFGYRRLDTGVFEKLRHIGSVSIGNDVEIGANTTIDRGMLHDTVISDGVKLDNLVHVAHNVRIGSNSAAAAQAGIAGSSSLGSRVRLGGQAGVSGHIAISNDIAIAAQSGVAKSLKTSGTYFGSPARPAMTAFKIEGVLNSLPDIARQVRQLEIAVKALSQKRDQPE